MINNILIVIALSILLLLLYCMCTYTSCFYIIITIIVVWNVYICVRTFFFVRIIFLESDWELLIF